MTFTLKRLRIFYIFFCILLLVSCSSEPNPYNKSVATNYLKKVNSVALSDTTRVKYIDSTYNYALSIKKDSISRTILFSAVRSYLKWNQNEQFLAGSRKLYQLSESSKDTFHMAKALYSIGDYYESSLELDSAFFYYSQSEKLFKNLGLPIELGQVTLYKAGILYEAGIFTESEIQTAKALSYLINTESDRLIYETYNLMGLNLTEVGNYEKAFDYFTLAQKQLDVLEENKYPAEKLIKSRASIYNNLGNLFERKKKYAEAIAFYNRGLASPKIKEHHPRLYAMLIDNLAFAKMKSGEKENCEKLFLKALKIRDSLDISSGIVTGTIHLGEFYTHTGDTSKGLSYLLKGYEKAKEIESTYDIKNALNLLSQNDKKNSDYYAKLYIKVADSLQTIERNTRNKFARIAFETEQVAERNESLLKKYTTTVLFFSLALLVLGTTLIIFKLKSKNKELQYHKKQQESNEKIYQLILEQQNQSLTIRNEERNRIAMELHDGIVNRIFATRFSLMQLDVNQHEKKEILVNELRTAETEIRKVSHDLQQNLSFEDDSFQSSLRDLVSSQANAFQTEFACSIDPYINWSEVSSLHKVHLYRITQEALQNVNKYSQASKCFVFLLKKGTQISLQITDNGVGFEMDKIKAGIGLKNIKQRVDSSKGTFSIISDTHGVTLEILF